MTIKHITKLSLFDSQVMLMKIRFFFPSRLAKLNRDKSTDGEVLRKWELKIHR